MASAALLSGQPVAAGPTTTTTPTVTTSSAPTTLVVTGHGFGHGVGMGQWGAYGYALHGWSYAQILAHYYPGTTIGLDPPVTVRVLLAAGTSSLALASASPWRLVDGAGQTLALPPGRLVVPASLKLAGRTFTAPLTFQPGSTPLQVGGSAYGGTIVVISDGKRLQVVNHVGLEPYLDGVVGCEMPGSWPSAALEAQAIAARSY
ncbi:MAG TPA: SpoIID/LytB domain-containing protein, partial [Acidimicrobiales bacterium]|nr:SpoIID/LytB domain-containing protein [Acidimicrobiales bacterium]